ncbi:hypothetical protein [Actinokineospora fastidiosa]|uniref:Uncharacterized protein n=1 Tax=Actinokineospora fastidiosa TaxID=1816 RepID=A0A918LF03_9PSEU|nr:hypothetical protein [Actinokineospora fastidiosa]GGS37953.1 hypothetical protein GCM10010171_36060 [Actinokineospora fastidiosa]
MRDRFTRWGLASVLVVAALLDGYLAVSENVLWPVALALLWVGLAAALLTARTPEPAAFPQARRAPEPRPVEV